MDTIRFFTLFLFACVLSAYSVADDRPNIVFLMTDDQTFDSLGCYGNKHVQTPNIDRLSRDGITFDSHYDTTAICMASRANVFTGRYEYKTGCNFGTGSLSKKLWNQSYPTLLRKSGYRTAFAGKFGVTDGKNLPEQDFDVWGGSPGQTSYNTTQNESMAKYAEKYPHSTRSYGAFGSDFVKSSSKGGQPFCLSISFKAPHRPTQPDPEYANIYQKTEFSKPANFGREHGLHFSRQSRQGRQYERFESWGYSSDFNSAMQIYHAQIYAVDVAVGMIRDAIREAGVENNTIIIFTSDNGFFNGAHGYGSKVLPYEEGARVPLIIYVPRLGKDKQGKRSSAITGNIDFAPTILTLAGIEAPAETDGVSLLPLLVNPDGDIREELQLMNCWGPAETHVFGIVTRDWKYLYWSYAGKGMQPAEELYNMRTDRLELRNAAKDSSSELGLAEMRRRYDLAVSKIADSALTPGYAKYGKIFSRSR